jgi:TPR repeat protein
MSFKKSNRHVPFVVLCCICLFIFGFTDPENDFNSAMDSYSNKDYPKAFQSFRAIAEKNYAKAEFMLGKMYYEGEGVSKDFKQAVHWYTKGAEQGNAEAQFALGEMCDSGMINYDGKGIPPQDYDQAVYWYKKAAEQGNVSAQFLLSGMYIVGRGVPRDYKKGVYWSKKAAEQGHLYSQSSLALIYYLGDDVPQDYNQAFYWYTKVAGTRYAQSFERDMIVDAQSMLGTMYYLGQGVSKDYKQALYWGTKAAEQGDSGSQLMLALIYGHGQGVPQNKEYASFLCKKAAEIGNSVAQRLLGEMYYNGEGVPQHYIYSYVWYNLAASQGDEKAIQFRDDISSLLSPQQLAQAQDLAAEIQYKINNPDTPKTSDQSTPPPSSASTGEPEIKSSGTGFIITRDGYLLTCLHVIEGAEIIKVAVGNDIQPAKVIRFDTNNDMALLKISGTFNALSFSPKRTANMGEEVFTIGYPNPNLQGINPKLTNGTINSLTGFKDDLRLYQISIPVQPGNSGGPLLDESGNVYGIIVSMLDAETAFKVTGSLPQNVNYAVKSTYAQALLDTLPDVASKLPSPATKMPFNEVVKRAEKSIVMVLVYQ